MQRRIMLKKNVRESANRGPDSSHKAELVQPKPTSPKMPAKAGIERKDSALPIDWVPAFAGTCGGRGSAPLQHQFAALVEAWSRNGDAGEPGQVRAQVGGGP